MFYSKGPRPIYIYIYIYTHIHTYIYIHTPKRIQVDSRQVDVGRGAPWMTNLSKSVNISQTMLRLRTFFPNLSTDIAFAATPLVWTPFVRNQDATQAVAREYIYIYIYTQVGGLARAFCEP